MTPKVLERELEAARLRSIDDYRRDVTLAWNISRVFFTSKGKKQLVKLSDLLDEVKTSRSSDRQTAGQMKAVLGVLSEMYRIPIRKQAKKAHSRG